MLRFTVRGLTAAVLPLLLAPFVAAQGGPSLAPQVTPAPPSLMQQFDVSVATVQSLQLPAGSPLAVNIDVVLAGIVKRISVVQHDVRSPNFQLFENGVNGMQLQPTPACVTYRGAITGDPGSDVAATVVGGSTWVFARTSTGDLWIIQPVRDVQPNVGPAVHIVFRGADSVQLPVQCGVQGANLPAPSPMGEDVLYLTDMGIEADYQFYQLNGSNSANTQNDITGIVNSMNVIYERDVDIRLVISQIVVHTSNYYSTSNASSLLNQFRSHWNGAHAGIPRDFAHLFTGRNISGGTIGIAYLGVVCNLGTAYGLSQNRFTGNYSYRVGVTAHEIGHNFGAGHCNSAGPCHIMCSGIGGCNGNPTLFGTTARNQIISFRQSVGCLTQQSSVPVIASLSPSFIKTANPALVTILGSGMTGTTHVTVGSTVVNNMQVLNDTQLRFIPPTGLSLGVQTVNVTNSAGTSNTTGVFYTLANPAELVVPAAVIGGNNVTWTMGGWSGDFAFLVISLTNTASPWVGGWPLVNNPVVFWTGGLNGLGMATYSFPVPSMTLNGLTVYTQLLDMIPSPLGVRSTSVVKSTLIVL
jgi:hypothetical protein